jgi:hypothetical protein
MLAHQRLKYRESHAHIDIANETITLVVLGMFVTGRVFTFCDDTGACPEEGDLALPLPFTSAMRCPYLTATCVSVRKSPATSRIHLREFFVMLVMCVSLAVLLIQI